MSLRLRLFATLGGLVALLVLAQWWWVRSLTHELSHEVGWVASEIGHSVAAVFTAAGPGEHSSEEPPRELPDGTGQRGLTSEKIRRVVRVQATAEEDAAPPTGGEGEGILHSSYSYTVDEDGERRVETVEWIGEAPDIFHLEAEGDRRFLELSGAEALLRIPIPEQGLRASLDDFSRRLLLGSLTFLGLGLLLAALLAHRATQPLRRLVGAARAVGDGSLGTRIDGTASGEVGEAIAAFNRMSARLQDLDARHRELAAQRHLGEIGDVARGLAHSLRNPLNALGLSVDELAADGDEHAAELAAAARRQIRRMDTSLRSLLALASQGAGVAEPVDLGELARDVALEARQDAGHDVHIDVFVEDAATLPALDAVEPELRAVVQALVVNAVEASPPGGRVAIRVAAAEGRWRLDVDDDGDGLPATIRARLFTPHLSTKPHGSGMGLFLAHRIVTGRYGGHLELLDLEPRGTRARLVLAARGAGASDPIDG